jgi:hypothetical protein
MDKTIRPVIRNGIIYASGDTDYGLVSSGYGWVWCVLPDGWSVGWMGGIFEK